MKNLSNNLSPTILFEQEYNDKDLIAFQRKHPVCRVVDQFALQVEELFEIRHPQLKDSPHFNQRKDIFIADFTKGNSKIIGNWVYFPWRDTLIHILKEDDFYLVKTNRNKLLINKVEQQQLRNFSIGFVGLSIGGVMAQTMMRMGISNKMKLIDFDRVSVSNLNRLPHGVLSVGNSKAIEEAQLLYEIDPYARLQIFDSRLSPATLQEFFSSAFSPDLVVDAIDDFKMKVEIRREARKRRIPVVMLTSLGDRLLVDIERYDIDQNYPLFHGMVDDVLKEITSGRPITTEMMKKFSVQLVGMQNVPERAMDSLAQIHKTLVGRPQLYSTVLFGSATLSKIVRKIALKKSCKSGRYKRSIL